MPRVKTNKRKPKLPKGKCKVEIKPAISALKGTYIWCGNAQIPNYSCVMDLVSGRCPFKCQEGVKKRIMASRSQIREFLDELEIEYSKENTTLELVALLVKAVRKIGHVDNFSPELRKSLINEYNFKIVNEKGERLDEFLNVKEKEPED